MLIFLDIETTGLLSDDVICSMGLVVEDKDEVLEKYELFNEGKKIPSIASSIHHITNEMIENELSFQDSQMKGFLEERNMNEATLIGHNIDFDKQKLKELGFEFNGACVDTLRVAKHLIPDCESYALQVLRYELGLYRFEDDGAKAHHALSDAKLTKLLFEYLSSMATLEEMVELSSKSVLLERFSFGKYKGKYIEEICMYDRSYVEWMLSSLVDLDDDLRYSINHHLQG